MKYIYHEDFNKTCLIFVVVVVFYLEVNDLLSLLDFCLSYEN